MYIVVQSRQTRLNVKISTRDTLLSPFRLHSCQKTFWGVPYKSGNKGIGCTDHRIKSASTLMYIAIGYHDDKFNCTYKRTNNVLHVIFDYDQISTLRKEQRDSISTLDIYPLFKYDSTRWEIMLNIRYHKLINKISGLGKTRKIKFVKVN